MFPKLKEIYNSFLSDNSISADYKQKVKISSIKLKKEIEQKSKEEQKKVEETGEFTQKPESKAQQATQGAPNNENKQQKRSTSYCCN